MASAVHISRDSRSRVVPRIGAFFDMDKTLIAENSGSVFMKHRYEKGEIGTRELIRGLGDYLRYKAGILDLPSWARGAMKEFAGRSEAIEIIRSHQEQGHIVAIVSGSTRFAVEPLAEHLGIEHSLFTVLEAEQGILTGNVIEPICFEEGKIYWLRNFIDDHNIDLALSHFYTDSITDLPLLELVGHPVVVNPDPVLYRAAVRRHWPVRVFPQPGASAATP